MAGQVARLVGGQIEQVNYLAGPGCCQPVSIVAKCDCVKAIAAIRLAINFTPTVNVPNFYLAAVAAGRQPQTVRTKGQALDPPGMPGKFGHLSAGRCLPEPNAAIIRC